MLKNLVKIKMCKYKKLIRLYKVILEEALKATIQQKKLIKKSEWILYKINTRLVGLKVLHFRII